MSTIGITPFRRWGLLFLTIGLVSWMAACSKKSTSPSVNNHVAGAKCAATGCHTTEHQNWSNTLHAATAAGVLLNSEHDHAELLNDECLNCHAPFQATRYHAGDFVQPLDTIGPWHLVDTNTSKWEAIWCETCHDPKSTKSKKLAFYNVTTGSYDSVHTTTELCEKCHQAGTDDSRDLAGSVHEGVQCATCHLKSGAQMSLDPHGACGQCHPAVRPAHPDVTSLNTTYSSEESPNNIHFIRCTTCHPDGPHRGSDKSMPI